MPLSIPIFLLDHSQCADRPFFSIMSFSNLDDDLMKSFIRLAFCQSSLLSVTVIRIESPVLVVVFFRFVGRSTTSTPVMYIPLFWNFIQFPLGLVVPLHKFNFI